MGRKGFECVVIVDNRGSSQSISAPADRWDFPTQPSLEFTENGPKKRNYPVSDFSLCENTLLMSEVRG